MDPQMPCSSKHQIISISLFYMDIAILDKSTQCRILLLIQKHIKS